MTTSDQPSNVGASLVGAPQKPRAIKISRSVKRKVTPAAQQVRDAGAMNYAPTPISPVSPPTKNHAPVRLKSFASSGVDHLPTVALPAMPGPARKPTLVRRMLQKPSIEEGRIILHRSPNFYVGTTNRHGQRAHPLRKRSGHTTLIPKVVPEQEKQIAASETRILPSVEAINPMGHAIPLPAWMEAIIVSIGLVATLVSHAFNLFYFPHYELDEGTYMSSAWAILHGMIEPYPYGYGHPPLGWIQIAAWVQLTGGFFTFGNALNTGRVLMLFYALGSSLLVYLVIRRLEGSRSAALLAMIIFSLSPLSIVYQRQVFLDNIGTFWLLLSLYLLVISNSRLLYIVLAGMCFGIALLSKEIFVLFIPAMIYALWLHTTRFQRKFALVAFTYTIISIGSEFVLLAVLKGELLPAGLLPWDHHPHLSMFDTFLQQAQRSQSEGSFAVSWAEWTGNDSLLIAFGVGATLMNLIAGWWKRKLLLLGLFAASYWVLLLRGGVIFPFYLIPMLPLIAFNAATAIHTVVKWISQLQSDRPSQGYWPPAQGRRKTCLYYRRHDLIRFILIFGVIVAIISY